MGHGEKFVAPDYKQYKIDGLKQLEWTRDALKEKGLKDPWLRNEAWRYKNYPGVGRLALMTVFRGFKWGAAAFLITVIADKATGFSESQHDHDH